MGFDIKIITSALQTILNLLPRSPFTGLISYLQNVPYLGYINWFIPMSTLVSITKTWLAAITTFYLISVVLRWARAVA